MKSEIIRTAIIVMFTVVLASPVISCLVDADWKRRIAAHGCGRFVDDGKFEWVNACE